LRITEPWSDEEDDILRRHYADTPMDDLVVMLFKANNGFFSRTPSSITSRCRNELNITRDKAYKAMLQDKRKKLVGNEFLHARQRKEYIRNNMEAFVNQGYELYERRYM